MHFDTTRHFFVFFLLFIEVNSGRLLEDREVICSSDRMVLNLSFERPFHGLVFSENQFEHEECKWRGNGGHYLLVVVPLDYSGDNSTSFAKNEVVEGQRTGFCGLRFDQKTGKHSINFVLSPDPQILTEEAFALSAHCVQSTDDIVMTLSAPSFDSGLHKNQVSFLSEIAQKQFLSLANSTDAPALSLRILSEHGLQGPIAFEGSVGRRLTLDAQLEDTSIFDMFLHDCIAHDGSRSEDATVSIIDANGCAVKLTRAIDAPVFTNAPQQNSSKHVYVYIYGFQFTSSDWVHFECKASVCVNECPMNQCQAGRVWTPRDENITAGHLAEQTLRARLQIVAPTAGSHTQAMQRNPRECIEPSTAGLVCLGAFLIFLILFYFTKKLIYSYQRFLRDGV
ncbi:ZP domain-containing protein [Aphelenchoides bicaudatus]|nr:ZP domain-containing protein [Aphelenchoides bicaudatus]